MFLQCRVIDQAQESSSGSSDDRVMEADNVANKISEDILKCLCTIFMRLSTFKGKTADAESCPSNTAKEFGENNVERDFRDPYFISPESRMGDVGPYRRFHSVESCSIDLNRKANALFLIRRLKYDFMLLLSFFYYFSLIHLRMFRFNFCLSCLNIQAPP